MANHITATQTHTFTPHTSTMNARLKPVARSSFSFSCSSSHWQQSYGSHTTLQRVLTDYENASAGRHWTDTDKA